jgi:nucleoside-diphosphate-sugar epimerase
MIHPARILVTGSAGRIGHATSLALAARGHHVRGFDMRPTPGLADAIVGDISDPHQVRRAVEGMEVVVHLAATPDEDDFLTRLVPNNIIGLYHVMESVRQAGVRRLILASSGQVVMGNQQDWPMTVETPLSPINWYSSAKVMAEMAGRVYAQFHGLSVIAVRLGWCPRGREHAVELAQHELGKDLYLSPRDAGRFFICAVEAPKPIDYCVVFATSKPLARTLFDQTATRDLLGYVPQDTWPEGSEDLIG